MIIMYGMSVNKNRVIAEFGTGDICMAPIKSDEGGNMLGLCNQAPREIGSVGDYLKGDVVDLNEFPVILKFNKLECIDVLIKALRAVKKQFADGENEIRDSVYCQIEESYILKNKCKENCDCSVLEEETL